MKQKHYYLVAHWPVGLGASFEHPAYYLGPYNAFFEPGQLVNLKACYKTERQALSKCAKLCTRYWSASVVEVDPVTRTVLKSTPV